MSIWTIIRTATRFAIAKRLLHLILLCPTSAAGKSAFVGIDAGHDIYQGDLDDTLTVIPDNSYDYAILSSTLQVVRRPRIVLNEMLRVAEQGIVTFPNFANWRNRLSLAFRGRMPKSPSLPHEWYDTPNIHLTTLNDFVDLCNREKITVLEIVCIPGKSLLAKLFIALGLRNLGAERVLIRITRKTG